MALDDLDLAPMSSPHRLRSRESSVSLEMEIQSETCATQIGFKPKLRSLSLGVLRALGPAVTLDLSRRLMIPHFVKTDPEHLCYNSKGFGHCCFGGSLMPHGNGLPMIRFGMWASGRMGLLTLSCGSHKSKRRSSRSSRSLKARLEGAGCGKSTAPASKPPRVCGGQQTVNRLSVVCGSGVEVKLMLAKVDAQVDDVLLQVCIRFGSLC